MKLPPLQTSWDPPMSHQRFLLYLPTSRKETRQCCWCWFSSVLVKYISLSGFSPIRSMSFDGLPKMRWKWNPLKWEQWSPKRQRSSRIANSKSSIKAGTQTKTDTTTFAIIRVPSIHTHPYGAEAAWNHAQVNGCRCLLTWQACHPVSYTMNSLEHL